MPLHIQDSDIVNNDWRNFRSKRMEIFWKNWKSQKKTIFCQLGLIIAIFLTSQPFDFNVIAHQGLS